MEPTINPVIVEEKSGKHHAAVLITIFVLAVLLFLVWLGQKYGGLVSEERRAAAKEYFKEPPPIASPKREMAAKEYFQTPPPIRPQEQ